MVRFNWRTRMLGKLQSVVRPVVSRADALRIAEAHCREKGWPWEDPVIVNRELLCYYIMTNAEVKGGNVNIRVSLEDGSIIHSGFAAR